ncbi:hypothetical protein [Kordia sp.]|uniref:hypothetical protein n=1 Tax=Kordia sp. TaxID=1965332 RepID=UPI0025C121A2|nr:hypothetical protein [Kordia sp.]MCH2195076.1 hypothetical protein [Kordia sp.]
MIKEASLDQDILSNMSQIETIHINNERFYKISNSDTIRPFFMSIVSDSDHWMFISSNGGLTAGRKNAEFSLFPYYTDDKITESAEITGSKSIFQVTKKSKNHLWEPFSERFEGMYHVTRNLYKNNYGNKVLFEEVNHDLELTFRYQWNSSDEFGFVKTSNLTNNSQEAVQINVIDGIQNVLPYGVGSDIQNASSNLVDAYKRTELEESTGLGIFALSAIIVDKAEPSEALKANVVWSLGIENAQYLLSSLQLNAYRKRHPIQQETDVKAEKGAYFINAEIYLQASESKDWMTVANVNQDHNDIAALSYRIKSELNLATTIQNSINAGTERLLALNAASDSMQLTADKFRDTRHFSNTLFNIMRGGIFDNHYQIEKWDFKNYLAKANKKVARTSEDIIDALPEEFSLADIQKIAYDSTDKNFRRLCLEYMPLKFSRRHGDPSRPWNKFSINTRSEVDGSKILDYEGNWRDIFQNWEALAHSYPEFIESMIHKFLNATTFDGYNPYRITKDGFDWEVAEPDDPWSYIGYWGDHQIIYLQKFLEIIESHKPGRLESFFDKDLFVYANVPYKIKQYQDLLKNPKDTIEFDEASDHKIRQQRDELGADGALLRDENRFIVKVNFIEKILATTLAKISNFIPEGGIWMNTQRPEWNDANNALVGNGVSMVTLCYLRRFLKFFETVFDKADVKSVDVSKELVDFFRKVAVTLTENQHILTGKISDKDRKTVLDGLGEAGSVFREQIYDKAFSGRKSNINIDEILSFVTISLAYLEHAIEANKREDNLYHAYNLMTVEDNDNVSISYLNEMLEGQVAVLSSGYISSKEALAVLDGLKGSKLFRPDQYSYLLYPNKELKGFIERNTIPKEAVVKSALLNKLLNDNDGSIITRDINGDYHFNGNFKNAGDLSAALEQLSETPYQELAQEDASYVLEIFEEVFNHKAFTGRSGTFYGYEGLGSIYWHMVSKLQLAVLECCLKAIRDKESAETIGRLLEHYYEINEGIGVHKSPSLYGAFPTDPYSHTPAGKGAQQPGMTGQVKEDILSRFGELGVFVGEGKLYFDPCMLRKDEFLLEDKIFNYVNINSQAKELTVAKGSLCFTYCQVPIVYTVAEEYALEVHFNDGTVEEFNNLSLNKTTSQKVFERVGEVIQINVRIKKDHLK